MGGPKPRLLPRGAGWFCWAPGWGGEGRFSWDVCQGEPCPCLWSGLKVHIGFCLALDSSATLSLTSEVSRGKRGSRPQHSPESSGSGRKSGLSLPLAASPCCRAQSGRRGAACRRGSCAGASAETPSAPSPSPPDPTGSSTGQMQSPALWPPWMTEPQAWVGLGTESRVVLRGLYGYDFSSLQRSIHTVGVRTVSHQTGKQGHERVARGLRVSSAEMRFEPQAWPCRAPGGQTFPAGTAVLPEGAAACGKGSELLRALCGSGVCRRHLLTQPGGGGGAAWGSGSSAGAAAALTLCPLLPLCRSMWVSSSL